MTSIRCWQVDAFADRPFGGNPAAVCWVDHDPGDDWMQAVAAEMNLSETAFVRRVGEGYGLRWFTPRVEVPLCGHATLASAHALWESGIHSDTEPIRFHSKSGALVCRQRTGFIWMDFPAISAQEVELPEDLMAAYQASARGGVVKVRVLGDRVALGGQAVTVWRGEWLAMP